MKYSGRCWSRKKYQLRLWNGFQDTWNGRHGQGKGPSSDAQKLMTDIFY